MLATSGWRTMSLSVRRTNLALRAVAHCALVWPQRPQRHALEKCALQSPSLVCAGITTTAGVDCSGAIRGYQWWRAQQLVGWSCLQLLGAMVIATVARIYSMSTESVTCAWTVSHAIARFIW